MKKFAAAGLLVSLFSAGAFATTWIGTISDSHCGPGRTGLPGDDPECIVFVANDKEVYKFDNPDAIQKHIGHEVSLTGTLNEEIMIGVTYETQGILHVDSVKMLSPVELSSEEQSQFQTWMKSMQPQVTAVRNAIVAKDNTTVSTEANKLTAAFDLVTGFWQKHQNADALQFAVTARDAAKSVAAAQTQFEQTQALQKVQGACSGCHLAHRAGKPGDFKMEQ